LFQVVDEDLAVADLSGTGRVLDGLDGAFDDVVGQGGFDLHFRQKVDHVFGAPIELRVSLLPAEAFDFGDGDALYANAGQSFALLVKLERLDDGCDEFHVLLSLGIATRTSSKPTTRRRSCPLLPCLRTWQSGTLSPSRSR